MCMPSPAAVLILLLAAPAARADEPQCEGGTCDLSKPDRAVTFTSAEEGVLTVTWLSPEGKEVTVGDIEPGQSFQVNSFVGHELRIRDKDTNKLRIKHVVVSPPEDNKLIIGNIELASQKASSDDGGGLEALGPELYPNPVSYISRYPSRSREIPMGAKFRNFYPYDLEYYYDDGSKYGAYNGIIKSMGRGAINTYSTHSFILCKRGTKDRVGRVTMVAGENIIILQPKDEKVMKKVRQSQFYKDTMEEVAFMKDYQNRTGLPWLSFYPRSPPILHMWDADYIGQEHLVESPEDGHPMQLKLKVISLRPRVFYVGEIITEQEVQHIMQLSKLKVKRSAVGNAGEGFLTDTRTSRTAWLRRDVSPEMDRIFSRFAKVLNIPDERLTHHRNAENLQVVTYGPGQKYSPHHDFNDKGSPPQRFLTLFIYLKPADTEGGTGFPLAFGRKGMKVQPRAGSAVLWYNMLPDGNADEMSLHEGMPVGSGEKWGCNLWVWDPVVNF